MPTSIRFPVTVKRPDRNGYADTYEETRVQTQMEVGALRIRQMYRSSPRLFDVQWVLKQSEYAEFDRWFQDIVGSGVAEFDVQLLDDDETLKWFTCKWFPPKFEVSLDQYDNWNLKARLWSNKAPFDERPSGTDELEGHVKNKLIAIGALRIGVTLHGAMDIQPLKAGGKLALPMRGTANTTLLARGRMVYGVHGVAAPIVVIRGALQVGNP